MPLFKKKPDKEHQKILQKKLVIAEEKPDDVFDLSDCGIYDVPEGIFTKCKVWNKGALLLQNNFLKELKSGGELSNLINLKILDLSNNQFDHLPKTIQELKSLQRFDLSNNNLKKLPDEIGELKQLVVLNLSQNSLSSLPSTTKYWQQLETLDISENKYLTNLPVSLAYLSKLKEFSFDVARITYPQKAVTERGLSEIQRFFKQIKEDDFLHENLSSDNGNVVSSTKDDVDGAAFEAVIKQRELEKERERIQRLQLESQILNNQTENAMLIANAEEKRNQILSKVVSDQDSETNLLVKKFAEGAGDRNALLSKLYLEENQLDDTVNLILQMSERAKRTEQLLEDLEKEQERIDELVKISNEEAERLRKEEIIRNMALLLEEQRTSKQRWDRYENSRTQAWNTALKDTSDDVRDMTNLMKSKDQAQKEMMSQILSEEEAQKQAFQCLQFQKDAKLQRIREQIEMVENELQKLSLLELARIKEEQDDQINQLAEMRVNTAMMLTKLMDEQENREQMLRGTLQSMEEQRETETQDYWLIQYQRLLDSKPKILIDKVNKLDVFVVETVLNGNAREFLPMFARHSIDEQEMGTITDERLGEIGISDSAARSRILAARDSAIKIDKSKNKYIRQNSVSSAALDPQPVTPTAPEPEMMASSQLPTASFASHAECVVCLDKSPEVIFLNCGHVCACATCSEPLKICPLCRKDIIQKCRIYTS